MINFLRGFLDPQVRDASVAARAGVLSVHPEWKIEESRLRAREPDRYVFAVFYSIPEVVATPMIFQLVAVARGRDSTELLPTNATSPYWIRGRK